MGQPEKQGEPPNPQHIQNRINALLIQYRYADENTKKFIENRLKALNIQLEYATAI